MRVSTKTLVFLVGAIKRSVHFLQPLQFYETEEIGNMIIVAFNLNGCPYRIMLVVCCIGTLIEVRTAYIVYGLEILVQKRIGDIVFQCPVTVIGY